MGDLQKKLFQKKLREAEESLGLNFSEDASEGDVVVPAQHPDQTTNNSEKYELRDWQEFFKIKQVVEDIDGNKFMTYYTPPKSNTSPIFIFHHGAGSSALTFGALAKELVELMTDPKHKERYEHTAGIFAFDARGHGETLLATNVNDFSIESFAKDSIFLIKDLIHRENLQSNSIFLIGHSLGGSIFTKTTLELKSSQLKGLAMFDIVEDTAVHSLQGMHSYLQNLPQSFNTVSDAVDYHLRLNILRNKETALMSIPPLLKNKDGKYIWAMDLKKTVDYWDDWFTGLSKNFVNAPTSKLLILAGTDNLDKELMIGQMQGKYQLVVFQDSGHFIQEDVPKKAAVTLLDFWERNDRDQTVIKSTWGSNK